MVMKDFLIKIVLVLIGIIILVTLFYYYISSNSYIDKSIEDEDVIGRKVTVLENLVAFDITQLVDDGASKLIECPLPKHHPKLVGHFFSGDLSFPSPLLNKLDPSFSKSVCLIIESYECIPGAWFDGFRSPTAGYIVNCEGVVISLSKNQAVINDK